MSNRQKKPPRPAARARTEQREAAKRNQRLLLFGLGGVVAVVVLAIVLASVFGGDDEPSGPELAFNGVPLPAYGASPDPALGLKGSIFVTEDLDGQRVVTAGGGGPNDTAKVIMFVAHWCPVCQNEITELSPWLKANDLPPGVEVVTVSTFPDPNRGNYPVADWFADEAWPLPVLQDNSSGEIAGRFGIESVPGWVVLDNQNFVLARSTGALDPGGFQQLIDLAAASIPTPAT